MPANESRVNDTSMPGAPDRNMDETFYAILAGHTSPEAVMKQGGPYQTQQVDGTRAIRFGLENKDGEGVTARAVATIGACAVQAAAGNSAAKQSLTYWAETGAVDVLLRSDVTRDAFVHVRRPGVGQVASLAIAANLVDGRVQPPLVRAFATPAALSKAKILSDRLFYPNGNEVIGAARETIGAYAQAMIGVEDASADQALAHVYYDLIRRSHHASRETAATARRAWMPLFRAACSALGRDYRDYLLPQVADFYDKTTGESTGKPETIVISSVDLTRLPHARGEQRPIIDMRASALGAAESLYGDVDAALERYFGCRDFRERVVRGIANIYRGYPFVTEAHQRQLYRVNAGFRNLLARPDTLPDNLPGPHSTPDEIAAFVAAAEAYGVPGNLPPELRDVAYKHISDNLPWFLWRGITDLPAENLAASGISHEDILRFFEVRTGKEIPPYMVQLASQIITDNEQSVHPRGPRVAPARTTVQEWIMGLSLTERRFITNPSSHPKGAEQRIWKEKQRIEKQITDHRKMVHTVAEIDVIADHLRKYLETHFNTNIPSVSGLGATIEDPTKNLKLRALAVCAQGEAREVLSADPAAQLQFARHAAPFFSHIPRDQMGYYFNQQTRPYYELYLRMARHERQASAAEPPVDLSRLGRQLLDRVRTRRHTG